MADIFKIKSTTNINRSDVVVGIPGTGYAVLDDMSLINTGNLFIAGTQNNTLYQTNDADLTSLGAATGTNLLYYRAAQDTWNPVNLAPGIKFSNGILSDTREINLTVIPTGVSITTGDGRGFYYVSSSLSGYTLSDVHGMVGVTGGALTIQLARIRNNVVQDMLSTKLSINNNHTGSHTASALPVISTGDLLTNDLLRIDIDSTGSSVVTPKGLIVKLEARY